MIRIIPPLTVIIVLVFLPVSSAWWLYLPLSFFSIFLLKRIYATIFAGFILDSVYFGGHYKHLPILFGTSLAIAIIFILLRDKLRLDYVTW